MKHEINCIGCKSCYRECHLQMDAITPVEDGVINEDGYLIDSTDFFANELFTQFCFTCVICAIALILGVFFAYAPSFAHGWCHVAFRYCIRNRCRRGLDHGSDSHKQ